MNQRITETICRPAIAAISAAVVLVVVACVQPAAAQPAEAPAGIIRSTGDGAWSDAATWSSGKVPGEGDRVQVRTGHRVVYDADSDQTIRAIHVAGVLTFATDRDTRLDVGLIRIEAGDQWKDGGFDCHAEPVQPEPGKPRPTLAVGMANKPIPAEHRALIRLVHFEGDDPETLPAIVCCAGRMAFHGAPMQRTWVKLARASAVGDNRLYLAGNVAEWRAGDRIVVTATSRQRPFTGNATPHVTGNPASEVRTIDRIDGYGPMIRSRHDDDKSIYVDRPLEHPHRVDDGYAGEVANLSRNVVIESANPDGVRGHTMYHKHSAGSISYVEFRHLGKKGVLGKYPIHYHRVDDTMRGSSVIGASIWDSHNRWVTLHESQYIVVRDCVGFISHGHGFYLENGKEMFNTLDRNLAIQALVADALPEQELPFDRNDGAGFWWANSLNAFTRNVAVECDQHGYRFEAVKTESFDPTIALPQRDGSTKSVDLRTIPFIRFDDNEAHAMRRFAMNLGGIRGMVFSGNDRVQTYSIDGDVDGVGPDLRHPFVIRNLKVWDAHWSFHAASPSVLAINMDLYDGQYGIWRSIVSRHVYRDLSLRKFASASLYFPMGGYGPQIKLEDGRPSFPQLKPVDDLPPATTITHVTPRGDTLIVRGTTIDNAAVARVMVNGKKAAAVRPDFAEWKIELPVASVSDDGLIRAHAVDKAGHVEPDPHEVPVHTDVAGETPAR